MSDSEEDAQISVHLPAKEDQVDEKPAKKPRKQMEVSERRRAASSANLAKAREARLKKKQEKLAAEDETQAILKELVAEKKKARAECATPVFGEPEKPSKKKHTPSKPLTESEESEESSSEEDSDVEFVLKPTKKKVPTKEKKSAIMEELEAVKAELASLRKEKKKKSKPAPVNVYVGGRQTEKKVSALDAKVQWD